VGSSEIGARVQALGLGAADHPQRSAPPGAVVARIGWLADPSRFFATDLAGKGGGVSSFAADCL